jgi:hypothetical protein
LVPQPIEFLLELLHTLLSGIATPGNLYYPEFSFKIVQLHEDSLTTNGREWTRRNVSDSRPLVSIRGSFFVPSSYIDFGAMPHCVPSEVFYSRAFASIRGSGIRSVPSQPLSGFALSVLLSLNFGHFREDSSRASEALPRRLRRYAHTPIRSFRPGGEPEPPLQFVF